MIVTRLKRGWRIHLTDNEMDALKECVEHGMADFTETSHTDPLPNGVRRTLRSDRWQSIDGPLSTDDDRRGTQPNAPVRPLPDVEPGENR
jgi:hypothetical protein